MEAQRGDWECVKSSSGLAGACPKDTGMGGLINTPGKEGIKVKLANGQVPRLLMVQLGGQGGCLLAEHSSKR